MAGWGGQARPAMRVPGPSAREAASVYGTAVAVFLVILVAALQGSAPPESPFPYRIPLDPEGILELSWNVSYVQETVHFQLLVRELKAGVLFGMSDRGELENADLVVLWTDGDSAYFGVSLPSAVLLNLPFPLHSPCLTWQRKSPSCLSGHVHSEHPLCPKLGHLGAADARTKWETDDFHGP